MFFLSVNDPSYSAASPHCNLMFNRSIFPMFHQPFWHVLGLITWLYTQINGFSRFYGIFQTQACCLSVIAASPYLMFLNQAFINFSSGISELHGITWFGNLWLPLCLLPAIHVFHCNSLRFFLFVCIICFSTSLFYHFPYSPSVPYPFLIFPITLFVLFHLQNMFSYLFSHCSFRISH